MPKGSKKRCSTREFRDAAVRLVTVERVPLARAAADLGMPVNTLTVWVSHARRGRGSFTPAARVDLAARVRELETECRRPRIERDILKKTTAFFAGEGGQP